MVAVLSVTVSRKMICGLLWWLFYSGDWVVGRGGVWVVGCSGVAKMVCELLW